MANRNGLIVDAYATSAGMRNGSRRCARSSRAPTGPGITGADKAHDAEDFVNELDR
jgi:hypothetical protein